MFMFFERFHSKVSNIPFEDFIRYVHENKYEYKKIKTRSQLLVVVETEEKCVYIFGFSDRTHLMSSAEIYV